MSTSEQIRSGAVEDNQIVPKNTGNKKELRDFSAEIGPNDAKFFGEKSDVKAEASDVLVQILGLAQKIIDLESLREEQERIAGQGVHGVSTSDYEEDSKIKGEVLDHVAKQFDRLNEMRAQDPESFLTNILPIFSQKNFEFIKRYISNSGLRQMSRDDSGVASISEMFNEFLEPRNGETVQFLENEKTGSNFEVRPHERGMAVKKGDQFFLNDLLVAEIKDVKSEDWYIHPRGVVVRNADGYTLYALGSSPEKLLDAAQEGQVDSCFGTDSGLYVRRSDSEGDVFYRDGKEYTRRTFDPTSTLKKGFTWANEKGIFELLVVNSAGVKRNTLEDIGIKSSFDGDTSEKNYISKFIYLNGERVLQIPEGRVKNIIAGNNGYYLELTGKVSQHVDGDQTYISYRAESKRGTGTYNNIQDQFRWDQENTDYLKGVGFTRQFRCHLLEYNNQGKPIAARQGDGYEPHPHGILLAKGNQIYLDNTLLYKGKWDEYKAHDRGVLVRTGEKWHFYGKNQGQKYDKRSP